MYFNCFVDKSGTGKLAALGIYPTTSSKVLSPRDVTSEVRFYILHHDSLDNESWIRIDYQIYSFLCKFEDVWWQWLATGEADDQQI